MRLKSESSLIQSFSVTPTFSPNQDKQRDLAKIRFKLKVSAPVDVEIVDRDGRTIAPLLTAQQATAWRRIEANWNGKANDGRFADDGQYYVRINVPKEGRSVVIPKAVNLDTTAPRPKVSRIEGAGQSTATIMSGLRRSQPIKAVVSLGGWQPTARIVKTAPGHPAVITKIPLKVTRSSSYTRVKGIARPLEGQVSWNGKDRAGNYVKPGTYVIQVCVKDRAQNTGCGPRLSDKRNLVVEEANGRFRGRGGITVRNLGVEPTFASTGESKQLRFLVDSRSRPYSWVLERLGPLGFKSELRGRSRDGQAVLRITPKRRENSLLRLTVRANGRQVRVPAISNGRGSNHRVLVVLPAISWMGRAATDTSGDGKPDVLSSGENSRVPASRVLDGMPQRFSTEIQPLLQWLARTKKRFDLVTDLELASNADASSKLLSSHQAVLLAGQNRWITAGLGKQLRGYVNDGGKLAVLDPQGLRRTVSLSRSGMLSKPTSQEQEDVFGISSSNVKIDGSLTIADDKLELFKGTAGRFSQFNVGWPIEAGEDGAISAQGGVDAKLLSSALDKKNRAYLTGISYGKGTLINTGLPELATTIGRDSQVRELMESIWLQLSR